jgi:hypothetical protein
MKNNIEPPTPDEAREIDKELRCVIFGYVNNKDYTVDYNRIFLKIQHFCDLDNQTEMLSKKRLNELREYRESQND